MRWYNTDHAAQASALNDVTMPWPAPLACGGHHARSKHYDRSTLFVVPAEVMKPHARTKPRKK